MASTPQTFGVPAAGTETIPPRGESGATSPSPHERLLPLLVELNDLKRIRVAGATASLAAQIFRRAWRRVVAGEAIERVALAETARAVAAARLAGIDAGVLRRGGLSPDESFDVRARGFDAVADAVEPGLRAKLRNALRGETEREWTEAGPEADGVSATSENMGTTENVEGRTPRFVELLAEQPRAGATRPDVARVVLEPAESHADHCASVAVYAVLCAPLYGEGPALPFLAGLAHHLHNARLPDAGYAGDEIIGAQLPKIIRRFREEAVAELPSEIHDPVRRALAVTTHADTGAARAFQAADVFDRVLEMRWHAQSASFTLDVALKEMDIVHPGAVQQFHLDVLRRAGVV